MRSCVAWLSCLILLFLASGCAIPPEKLMQRELKTPDYLAAEALDAQWRAQGVISNLLAKETADAEGNRLIALRSLTLPLNDPLGAQQAAVEALAAFAAKGQRPMSLIVSVKTPIQQQQLGMWIKQGAIASGGQNSVMLDNRRGPANNLQVSAQYQP